MLTIPTATHIRGALHVKGFGACVSSTGLAAELTTSRLVLAEVDRRNRESRRRWLARQWTAHQVRIRARSGARHLTEHGDVEVLVR